MTPSTSMGWQSRFSKPTEMSAPHTHDDIELNLLTDRSLTYILNGRQIQLEPGRVLAFWAATPHEVVKTSGGGFFWVTVPLSDFLGWRQAGSLTHHLLHGLYALGPEGLLPPETAARWVSDFSGTLGCRSAAKLEIEAMFLRLAGHVPTVSVSSQVPDPVDRIRAMIAERYATELSVDAVARAVGLHPTHAMRAFKTATGATIGDTIASFRLAHAQRLLAMTDLTVNHVAIQSGFGSERRFHEIFRVRTGLTPHQYRTRTRIKTASD